MEKAGTYLLKFTFQAMFRHFGNDSLLTKRILIITIENTGINFMRKFVSSFLTLLFLFGCTKEIPESEKRILKTNEEEPIRQLVNNFVSSYNNNNIENALSFFDSNYKGVVADSDDFAGMNALREELTRYKKNYPDGKWQIEIDEINISVDYAFLLTCSSFLMPDVIENDMSPAYTERGIRIIKKNKDGNWKFYRYSAMPAFSYDKK